MINITEYLFLYLVMLLLAYGLLWYLVGFKQGLYEVKNDKLK